MLPTPKYQLRYLSMYHK